MVVESLTTFQMGYHGRDLSCTVLDQAVSALAISFPSTFAAWERQSKPVVKLEPEHAIFPFHQLRAISCQLRGTRTLEGAPVRPLDGVIKVAKVILVRGGSDARRRVGNKPLGLLGARSSTAGRKTHIRSTD